MQCYMYNCIFIQMAVRAASKALHQQQFVTGYQKYSMQMQYQTYFARFHSEDYALLTLIETLGRWFQCPLLDTSYLCLPRGIAHVVNLKIQYKAMKASMHCKSSSGTKCSRI